MASHGKVRKVLNSAFLLYLIAFHHSYFIFQFFVGIFNLFSSVPFQPFMVIPTRHGLTFVAVSLLTSAFFNKYLKKKNVSLTLIHNLSFQRFVDSLSISKLVLPIQKVENYQRDLKARIG